MRPIVLPSVVFLVLLVMLLLSSTILGQQQGQWGQVQPPRVPAQFASLLLLLQNSQDVSKQTQRMSGQTQSKTNSFSTRPVLGGKIHLMSTLWRGLRNTGLEATIAGDILERLIKVSLRDILVPFKRDVIFPLMS